MDINIQDLHYQKYIKYKKKYLELKQSGGIGKPKVNVYGSQYNNMKTLIKKLDNKSDTIYLMQQKILLIEDFLLNKLLTELMKKNSENKFIDVYKEICYTIICYREYFYITDRNEEKRKTGTTGTKGFLDFINFLKDSNIKNIHSAQNNINKHLNSLSTISKFKNLKKIIKIYFNYVKRCINDNIYSVIENNLIFDFYNLSGISYKIKDNITNDIQQEIRQLTNIPMDQENFKTAIDTKINNIKKLLKLQVLFNNNNNIDTDNNIMLINCYFILIKLMFRNYKSIKIPYDNFLFGGSEKKIKITEILNTLINIIYYYTIDTSKLNGKEYEIEYNNKKYYLPEGWKILYDAIQYEIINDKSLLEITLFNELNNYVYLITKLQQ